MPSGAAPAGAPDALPAPSVEAVVRAAAGTERTVGREGVWVTLDDPEMPEVAHGWKLHVSTRPGRLLEVARLVVPVLLRHTCLAKFAASPDILLDINGGTRNPASVGKAITVYPAPSALRALANDLAEALHGQQGPSVPSDRRLHPQAPVYYRYGPFHAEAARGPIIGPHGERFPGLAESGYRQPAWLTDPFQAAATPPRPPRPARLAGGRFELVAGIVRSPTGHVYRGVDTRTGERVVVKQARAFVGEDGDGIDARGRLRNERAVLGTLAGLACVPRLIDYFKHGEDEYLVTSDCGRTTLRRDVLAGGPYTIGGAERNWHHLAEELASAVGAVHRRGIVIGDLKPDNVVIDESGRWKLIDFGVSAREGEAIGGATPGYSRPVFRPGAAADAAGDRYALGATLHYALTGLDPVTVDPDDAVNRERTLACLTAVVPDAPAAEPRARIGRLMRWPAGLALPSPPEVTDDLLDAAVEGALTWCLEAVERLENPAVGLYEGTSGLGLELVNHADGRPQVRAAVSALARLTAEGVRRSDPGPSLFHGRAGADLFLSVADPAAAAELGADFRSPPDGPADQISGAAGVGTAHLIAASAARATSPASSVEHLAVAASCAEGLISGAYRLDDAPGAGKAAFADGYAHGRAGVAYFLLAYHRVSGDEASGRASLAMFEALLAHTEAVADAALRPSATRRYASWCRGLAGIASALATAGTAYGRGDMLTRSGRLTRVCGRLSPRLSLVSQCCGLAGVGEAYLDVALATGEEEFRDGARRIAALILARSGGTPSRPLFPDNSAHGTSWHWGTGTAGVLAFLRRLQRGGPRLGRLEDRMTRGPLTSEC